MPIPANQVAPPWRSARLTFFTELQDLTVGVPATIGRLWPQCLPADGSVGELGIAFLGTGVAGDIVALTINGASVGFAPVVLRDGAAVFTYLSYKFVRVAADNLVVLGIGASVDQVTGDSKALVDAGFNIIVDLNQAITIGVVRLAGTGQLILAPGLFE